MKSSIVSSISIKSKIYLLVSFPLLLVIFFMGEFVLEQYSVVKQMNSLKLLTELTVKIGGYVHETQKERGATAGFIGSEGKKFRDVLDRQRQDTNLKREQFNTFLADFDESLYDDKIQVLLKQAVAEMEKLDRVRSEIDGFSMSLSDAIAYYTNKNSLLLEIVVLASGESTNIDIVLQRSSYANANFMKGKERAGIERAVLTNAFSKDKFVDNLFLKFTKLVAEQETFFSIFNAGATSTHKELFAQTMVSESAKKVQTMRDIAYQKGKAIEKPSLLVEITRNFGYGGAIHNFKNYVLRFDTKYKDRFEKNFTTIIRIADDYKKLDLTTEEITALNTIIETLGKYSRAAKMISQMVAEGKSIKEIDSFIKISDGPALKAISFLYSHSLNLNFGIDPNVWFDTSTRKINL
ncbi:MAG: nitrate- and nitrite sensing domain-containing protein, partial [Desulfobacterales bacterium]|nr:nitrate- and nitrite sensing domain-containing protein [Desulfobacterales bacterium]